MLLPNDDYPPQPESCRLYAACHVCRVCRPPPLRPPRHHRDEHHELDAPLFLATLLIGVGLLFLGSKLFDKNNHFIEEAVGDNYAIPAFIKFFWILITFPTMVTVGLIYILVGFVLEYFGTWLFGALAIMALGVVLNFLLSICT